MINVRSLTIEDRYEVLHINTASRHAVATLDEIELSGLLGLANHHLVAKNNTGPRPRVIVLTICSDPDPFITC